jgi:hypothetical protein
LEERLGRRREGKIGAVLIPGGIKGAEYEGKGKFKL